MRGPDSSSSRKPGAAFAFKPQNTLHSSQKPVFPASPPRLKQAVLQALEPGRALGNNNFDTDEHSYLYEYHDGHSHSREDGLDFRLPKVALRDLSAAMVNERAPPKAPAARRDATPDDDIDIFSAVKGFASLKAGVRDPTYEPPQLPASSSSSSLMGPSKLGGHPKVVSSRKQQAGVFLKQKTRPEHHLDATKVRGPTEPTFHDRKPPPLPKFDSNFFTSTDSGPSNTYSSNSYAAEVFYTDPNKASADLKDLLEGVMDDDDDDDEKDASQTNKVDNATEENVDDPKSGVVAGLNVKLLPHQVEGVEWMRGRELGPVKRGKVPKGGILADDMGLGKTLQTLSLILTNQKPKKEDKSWKKHFEGIEKTTLVVAPLSLIRQWEGEIINRISKTHRLKVYVHHGPNRTKSFKELALYDVVVTTYQILVSEHGHSSTAEGGVKAGCFGLHWWRIVLDEAHSIKNRNAKATKACYALRSEYRWCLSGTPMQNNLDELQSLVKFLKIKPYDDLKEWKAHIDHPLKNGKGHIAIRRLHSILRCFMKRRTKEILKEEGALNPGGKPSEDGKPSANGFRVTARNVVTVASQLSPEERKFYNRLQARADRSMEAMMGGKVSYASALTLLLRMRQACNHPRLVAGKLDRDALSTGVQKSQEVEVDDVADMFAGMGIASKNCKICGLQLSDDDHKLARDNCSECFNDMAYFNGQGTREVKKTKKKRTKSKKVSKDAAEDKPAASTSKRRPRNRQAVIDSDDEDEGSWLVPENERQTTKLGKAGGEEDENAEGGGDWIGTEDSDEEDDDDKDKSNLSSFVVDDETARRDNGNTSVNDPVNISDDDDDDSLPSITAITQKLASQTLEDKPPASPSTSATVSGSDSETEAEKPGSGSDESDSDSFEDQNDWDTRRRAKEQAVVASAKIRELIKILHKEVYEHKFIVFSQFTSMLDIVEPFLEDEGFEYTRYDGSMKNDDREASLNKLRKDKDTRILLCSLKCGSLGLNLTAATRVVIIEPFWNPVCIQDSVS